MKKIFSIIILILIITAGNIAYAKDETNLKPESNTIKTENQNKPTIEVKIDASGTIEQGNNTYIIKISLGKFDDVEENKVMAFQTSLEYDENLIESVAVKGINNWVLSYDENSKILLGDVDKAKANQEIGQIEITLKEKLEVGQKGTIKLNELLLAGDNVEIKTNKEVNFEVVEKPIIQEDKTSENSSNTTNTKVDNTVANKMIPAAGVGRIILISIIIITILAVIFKFKSRKIKY